MRRPNAHCLLLIAALALTCTLLHAKALPLDSDQREHLGIPADASPELTHLGSSPRLAATPPTAPDILEFHAAHLGSNRLLLKTTFAAKADFRGAVFIIYLDLDADPTSGRSDPGHVGVDVMIVAKDAAISTNLINPRFSATKLAAVLQEDNLWISLEAPLTINADHVRFGVHLLSQRTGRPSDGLAHLQAAVPLSAQTDLPAARFARGDSLVSMDRYRFHNKVVALERLDDKGLAAKAVARTPPFQAGRPRPSLPSATPRHSGKKGSVENGSISLDVREEAGADRDPACCTFGVPFAQGAIFDTAHIRIEDQAGDVLASQFSVTATWPDGSLRWVRADVLVSLRRNARETWTLHFGNAVRAAPVDPIPITTDGDRITVHAGRIRAVIDRQRFNLLTDLFVGRNRSGGFQPQGVTLVSESGDAFTTAAIPPRSLVIEQAGPFQVVLRAEGDYANQQGTPHMSYVTRLTIRRDLQRVYVEHTHINTCLEQEFTDFQSLSIGFVPEAPATDFRCILRDERGQRGRPTATRAMQWHDQLAELDQESIPGGQFSGALWLNCENPIGVALQDFWQRWPKGFRVEADGTLQIDLLPKLPDPTFGADLPHYLMYPFVEGYHRLKWGMAFTERFILDTDSSTMSEYAVEAEMPVIVVIPAETYAETGAAGALAPPRDEQFAAWDRFVASCFEAHMQLKTRQREYGYLNYGDWFGERGRNWGNNEYDLAHGLFVQFMRSGDRQYARWALAAARHQADSDTVHAYPDAFYVGANHQHSIGHTGTWSQVPRHATWTHPYDGHTSAANGHTWADGLCHAWFLAGDPRPAEAAIALGEHITWAMAPTFNKLGTHERSAGWSLQAILALYRLSADPLYLETAERIAAVALAEQNHQQGGAWPHRLPTDHAGGHPGAVGNNTFLIGVLLSGLKDYHQAGRRQDVADALVSGIDWMCRSFDPNVRGWPYSADINGKGFYAARASLNALIAEAVAYGEALTGEPRYGDVAAQALEGLLADGITASGKDLAQRLVFADGLLNLLQTYAAERHGGNAFLANLDRKKLLQNVGDADNMRLRSPDQKVFYIRPLTDSARMHVVRQPHGARPRELPRGTLTLQDEAGKVVLQKQFSTDLPWEFDCDLPGPAAQVYRVTVLDDQRAVWDVGGDALQCVAEVGTGFSIGGVGRSRYHLLGPADTETFSVTLNSVHNGSFGGSVMTADGTLLAFAEGIHSGGTQLPWAVDTTDVETSPGTLTLQVTVPQEYRGHSVSLVLWARGDIRVQLRGIPPYLATRAKAAFVPPKNHPENHGHE